jgi:hypothetical protein
VHPPPSPARANFTLMSECTPESSACYSVYSVLHTVLQLSMIVYELDYAYFIFFVYCLVSSTLMSRGGRGKDYNVSNLDWRSTPHL